MSDTIHEKKIVEVKKKKKKKKKRCHICNMKLRPAQLIIGACTCNRLFCPSHRHDHDCPCVKEEVEKPMASAAFEKLAEKL